MQTLFLFIHVLAALLLIGPVAVATSLFPRYATAAHQGEDHARGVTALLHRLTKLYGVLSLLVPLAGIALFIADSAFRKQGVFHAAILLSFIAWLILFLLILPKQRLAILDLQLLDKADNPASDKEQKALQNVNWDKLPGKLSMFGGIFNLLWVITAALMLI